MLFSSASISATAASRQQCCHRPAATCSLHYPVLAYFCHAETHEDNYIWKVKEKRKRFLTPHQQQLSRPVIWIQVLVHCLSQNLRNLTIVRPSAAPQSLKSTQSITRVGNDKCVAIASITPTHWLLIFWHLPLSSSLPLRVNESALGDVK